MKIPAILALDPGSQTGFAYSAGPAGTWDLKIRPDESGGMRLVRFRGKLAEIQENCGLDFVAFEAPRNAAGPNHNPRSIQFASELVGILKIYCEENRIDYRGYSPGEIKRHATGKGNAPKADVLAAALERWPNLPHIDDVADAAWLLDLFLTENFCHLCDKVKHHA